MRTRLDALGYLRAHGISCSAAADAAGRTRQNIRNSLMGNPEVKTLLNVANGLGIDIRKFFVPLEGEAERKTVMELAVRDTLRAHGLNNSRAAEGGGMRGSDLTRILGGANVRINTLYALADGLGIDIREFFRPAQAEEEEVAAQEKEPEAEQEREETPAEAGKRRVLDIRRAAKERGVTLTELAERIGIWPQEMARRLRGDMRLSLLEKMADALGCGVPGLYYPESEAGEGEEESEAEKPAPEPEVPTIPSETIDKSALKVHLPCVKQKKEKEAGEQQSLFE